MILIAVGQYPDDLTREAFKLDDSKIRKWKGIEVDVSRDLLDICYSILVIMRTA